MLSFIKRFLSTKPKGYTADEELKELGYLVHRAYRESSHKNATADKEKIILAIEGFYELFKKTTSDIHHAYYRGNMISSARFEGNIEEILGTVDQAVARTIDFINNAEVVHASQCEFFSRNIDVILRSESFSEPPADILEPYLEGLTDIATGNIA
jgi:hypothetical protein